MSISLSLGAVVLALPDDLVWTDEFLWSSVSQSTERSVTGALLVDAMQRNGGRPITLEGGGDRAWISRADLRVLSGWAGLAGQVFTLSLRGESFDVIFDHGTDETTRAFAMSAVMDWSDMADGDYYCSLVLRFITTNTP